MGAGTVEKHHFQNHSLGVSPYPIPRPVKGTGSRAQVGRRRLLVVPLSRTGVTTWTDTPNLPRLKNRETLVKVVKAAVSGKTGPFAYAERWNPDTRSYAGLVMETLPTTLLLSWTGNPSSCARRLPATNRPAPPQQGRNRPRRRRRE